MSVTRRIDVGYPEDRDRAAERLDELAADSGTENTEEAADSDEAVVDG